MMNAHTEAAVLDSAPLDAGCTTPHHGIEFINHFRGLCIPMAAFDAPVRWTIHPFFATDMILEASEMLI